MAVGGSVARGLLPKGVPFREPEPTLGPLATEPRWPRRLDNIRVRRFFPEDYHALKGSVTTKTEAIGMLRKVAHGENVFNIYDFITLKRWTLLDDYKEDISWTYSGTTYTLKPESTIWVFPFPKNLMEKNGNFEHNYPVTQN